MKIYILEPISKNLVGVSVSVQYRAKNFDPFFMHAIYLYVELFKKRSVICGVSVIFAKHPISE